MNRFFLKENKILNISIIILFCIFFFTWTKHGGAWVYGLYSEVDGQLSAWLSKYLFLWASPFDMTSINPFQGMGSIINPINSWWNPGAFPLILPFSEKINYSLSYSIYWLEIFCAIYFLARTIGLTKIESVLSAQIFVLFLFPPFSAFFHTIPYFSLAPIYAHWMALISIITISFLKLGRENTWLINGFLLCILFIACYVLSMTSSFYFLPFVPIYALFCLGCFAQNYSKEQLLWKIAGVLLLLTVFMLVKGNYYYKSIIDYASATVGISKSISFSFPTVLQKHNSIFYGTPPLFSYLHILALLGGLIGLFLKNGKYRWIACSFILIILIPDAVGFLFENGIVSGSISQVNIGYYLWSAYPLYGIFGALFFSFVGNLLLSGLKVILSKLPLNINIYLLNIKLIIPFLIPMIALTIWFVIFPTNNSKVKPAEKSEIVNYLEKQIALKPGDKFNGLASTFLASEHSPLRKLVDGNNVNSYFTFNHYVLSREFLNKRFKNRHMFSDLWNFNIPTLEEYGQFITSPMYIFFGKMLSGEKDVLHHHFLNVYKLDPKILRSMGVRYIITDKIINNKDLQLIKIQNQLPLDGFVNYHVTLSAKDLLEELQKKYKDRSVARTDFVNEFKNALISQYPTIPEEIQKIMNYFESAINSALNQSISLWTSSDLEKVKSYFDIVMFTWMASPPVHLYEITHPNLANFSPTKIIIATSIETIFSEMQKKEFNFEQSILIQKPLPIPVKQLVPIINSNMSFQKNAVHVTAQSNGWSLLLLPLQYSHCYQITKAIPQDPVYLIRANLISGAILFKDKLDIIMKFSFGLGKHADCRMKDLKDMHDLGLMKRG